MTYRIPREPSTPRITIWRKLKNLGVAQIGDGLVALPNDERTREHLEWIAESVREVEGEAMVWLADLATKQDTAKVTEQLTEARSAEYATLIADIEANPDAGSRAMQRWRREWRKISRRDYFEAPLKDRARLAIDALASDSEPMTPNR